MSAAEVGRMLEKSSESLERAIFGDPAGTAGKGSQTEAGEALAAPSYTPDFQNAQGKSTAIPRIPKFFDPSTDAEDDTSPTFRHGILGDHFEIPVVNYKTSGKKGASNGVVFSGDSPAQNTHYIVYDCSERCVVTEFNFKLTGRFNPNQIMISYGNTVKAHLSPSDNSQWTIVKRTFVPETCKKMHVAWRGEEGARYWKVDVPGCWDEHGQIAIVDVLGRRHLKTALELKPPSLLTCSGIPLLDPVARCQRVAGAGL